MPLEEFFYISTDAMCFVHVAGQIVVVNPAFSGLLGYTELELKGKNWGDFVFPDDKEVALANVRKLTSHQGVDFENRLMAKDGAVKRLIWKAVPVDSGTGVLLVGRDITNEKVIQTELMVQNRRIAEAKARQEAVLASIGDGVVVVSDKGEVVFANEQALFLLGMHSEEILGKHLIRAIKVVDAVDKPILAESHPMQRAFLRGQKISTADFYFSKPDGKKFPVAITSSPVFLQSVLIGGVLVFRDITHEKEVDRMKTEFISLASHQLRTPLSAMKWFSEILLSGDSGVLTEEQKAMVNNIYLSNERMIELVNGLLNISRMESGRIIIDPRPTNLAKLVNEVLLELTPKIEQKKHKVAVSVHSQLPEINIDQKLIRHVYMNLLTNAIKYTPEGGEIQVIISRTGKGLMSQVSDNGYGIPAAQQAKVFQKFFRGDNVAIVETDGTGLGLYLVKAILEASGGQIWFKSVEGKGSTFWFSLPIDGSAAKQGEVSINS